MRPPRRYANLAQSIEGGHPMQRHPVMTLARLLMASVFVVMGAYRLWMAARGASLSDTALAFSAVELVLGLLLATGWKLRVTASLAAALMLADAVLSHRFWALGGQAQAAQLLHFMKNIGFVGGLLLLAVAGGTRQRR
jgi:putative oxidoreductase